MRNPSAPTNGNIRTPCCTKVDLKRGPWTPEEDELLASYITKEGEGRWRTLPKRAGLLRCCKSCRLRWMNYLRPCVKRGYIAPDEEDLILRLHRLLGNRWSLIAGRIPGRTDNEIKNYWNTHLSKKLISQGIDPRTHKPLVPSDNQLPAVNPNPSSNQNPNPNPNLNLEEDGSHEHGHAHCTQEGVFKNFESGTSNLDNERNTHNRVDMDNLQNGFQAESSHGNSEQEDDMDYCSDDIFSSFLNSLINDDTVVPQQHQHKHQASGEPHISGSGFGYGAFWDPTISSTPAANNDVENDRGFVDHASKRL